MIGHTAASVLIELGCFCVMTEHTAASMSADKYGECVSWKEDFGFIIILYPLFIVWPLGQRIHWVCFFLDDGVFRNDTLA